MKVAFVIQYCTKNFQDETFPFSLFELQVLPEMCWKKWTKFWLTQRCEWLVIGVLDCCVAWVHFRSPNWLISQGATVYLLYPQFFPYLYCRLFSSLLTKSRYLSQYNSVLYFPTSQASVFSLKTVGNYHQYVYSHCLWLTLYLTVDNFSNLLSFFFLFLHNSICEKK